MEDFRRRPPMEGFTRPGSLGGEAWNDEDSVEGHIMEDELRQDQDVEGHRVGGGRLGRADEEDTEGHGIVRRADEDDTEGHGIVRRADEDDTEGHAGWLKASEDDDTEGHAVIR